MQKLLGLLSLGMVLGFLATGCVTDVSQLSPDCLKITPTMGWEMQKGVATKKKPSITVCAEWKLKNG